MVASPTHVTAIKDAVDPNYDPLNQFGDLLDPAQNAGLVATFFIFPEQNAQASAREGRPVFDEKEFIRIERVGDKLAVNEREATEFDKARFSVEYGAFKRGDNQLNGIPIETLPGIGVGRIAELKAVKIHTVEALASVPDSALKHVGMDGIQLRNKASQFLDALREQRGEQAVEDVRQAVGQADAKNEERFAALEGAVAGIGGALQEVLARLPGAAPAPAATTAPETTTMAPSVEKKDIL